MAELARVLYGNTASRGSGARILELGLYTDSDEETQVEQNHILHEGAKTLLGHMAPYFPFKVDWPATAKRDIKVRPIRFARRILSDHMGGRSKTLFSP